MSTENSGNVASAQVANGHKFARKHYANIPRAVVLHQMRTAECLDSRVFWAMVLLSLCGPGVSETCVQKNAEGFIVTDDDGNPISATQKYIGKILGLPESMKAALSRTIDSLYERGSIGFGDKFGSTGQSRVMYIIREPSSTDGQRLPVLQPLNDDSVDSKELNKWYIGGRYFYAEDLPFKDPESRAAAVLKLSALNTRWNDALKNLRTEVIAEAVQVFSGTPIIIEEEIISLREEVGGSVQTDQAPEPTDQPTDTPQEKITEPETETLPPPSEESRQPEPPATAQNPEKVSAVEDMLITRLADRLKHLPSAQHCEQIAEALAGASTSDLEQRINDRWNDIRSYQFVVLLAQDVGEAWKRLESIKSQAHRKQEIERQVQYNEMIRDLRARWHQMPEDERKWYAQLPELADLVSPENPKTG